MGSWAVSTVPFLSPVGCTSVYLRHRDYSRYSCQQRASFRISLLHSMTSAEPSHLQQQAHNERERPHTYTQALNKRKANKVYQHTKFVLIYEAKAWSVLCKTRFRFSTHLWHFSFSSSEVKATAQELLLQLFNPPSPLSFLPGRALSLPDLKCLQVEDSVLDKALGY